MRSGFVLALLAFPLALNSTCRFPEPAFKRQDSRANCNVITSKELRDPKAPKFRSYRTERSERVLHPKVDLQSAENGRMFRTVLRFGARKGPNFAGHYRVVVWGCGTSCANFAVINLITGKIIEAENFQAIDGVNFEVDDFLPRTNSVENSFRYRKDSKLLVVLGSQDEDEARAGAFYYVLQNEQLVLLHATKVYKTCN